jgi:uncharacterized protein (DUF1697 family)
MADLRELLRRLGYGSVGTVLNSGNAVFDASPAPESHHAPRIQRAIVEELGVDTLVIVKSAEQIATVMAGNALASLPSDPSRLLVALTQDRESLAALKPLATLASSDEQLRVGRDAAYLWCAQGMLQSKVAVGLLEGLGDSGPTRNWATLQKIQALMQKAGSAS